MEHPSHNYIGATAGCADFARYVLMRIQKEFPQIQEVKQSKMPDETEMGSDSSWDTGHTLFYYNIGPVNSNDCLRLMFSFCFKLTPEWLEANQEYSDEAKLEELPAPPPTAFNRFYLLAVFYGDNAGYFTFESKKDGLFCLDEWDELYLFIDKYYNRGDCTLDLEQTVKQHLKSERKKVNKRFTDMERRLSHLETELARLRADFTYRKQ